MVAKLLEKISKELTLQQKWKDGIWLQQQVATKRLHPLVIEYMNIHSRLMQEVYPDKWDFEIVVTLAQQNKSVSINSILKTISYYTLDIQFHPVIWFENITISNSKKQSVPIKSIFVKLPVNLNRSTNRKYNIDSMVGARNIVSYNEYNNHYLHSHLPEQEISKYNLQYKQFCTGSGEINFMKTKINQGFQEGIFKTILFHLEGYLTWESLEGGPYMKIEDLFLKSKENDLTFFPEKVLINKAIHLITLAKIHGAKLNWIIKDNSYRIKDDDLLEQYCLWTNDKELHQSNEIYYKDNGGNYYPIDASVESVIIQEDAYLAFQGKKHKIKVEGLLDTSDRPFYIHPKIKKYVKQQLEFVANKEAIRYCATNKAQNTGNYAT